MTYITANYNCGKGYERNGVGALILDWESLEEMLF